MIGPRSRRRELEVELEDRLEHGRAGPPQRGHQHERGEEAVVRQRRARPLARRCLVLAVGHHDVAVGDLPAVEALAEGVARRFAASARGTRRRRRRRGWGSTCGRRRARRSRPEPGGQRRDRQADRGEERMARRPAARDQLDGRAGAVRPLDADRRRRPELDRRGRSRPAGSGRRSPSGPRRRATGTAPGGVSSWRRLMSGSCSASSVERVEHRPLLTRVSRGTTAVSSVGGAKAWSVDARGRPGRTCRRCVRVASPWTLAMSPAWVVGARCVVPCSKTSIAVTVSTSSPPSLDAIARPQRPGEHAHERDLLAASVRARS